MANTFHGRYWGLALCLALILGLAVCVAATGEPSAKVVASDPMYQGTPIAMAAAPVSPASSGVAAAQPAQPVATTIILADDNISIDGTGALAEGSTLTITADGVYEVKGSLTGGQILIDAPDDAKVELVLSGVDIQSAQNAAIYAMRADDLLITLPEGTQNVLTDATSYKYVDQANQEPNAALFSTVDLSIGGSGALTVNASFNNGISSKDDVEIEGGSYVIHAANHGIRGRDSVTVLGGGFEIHSGGDGIQSDNVEREDRGFINLLGGNYVIQSNGDAIQAETALTISGGTYNITTSGQPKGDSTSQKGLKAGTLASVEDGQFQMDVIDDGVHSNGDVIINGGTFTIQTQNDGMHADDRMIVNGGIIDIPVCYEGFEGTTVEINGGKSFINSEDDAVSAANGTEASQGSSRRGADDNVYARITGGELEAVSGGDTIDANGNVFVDGGMIRLSAPIDPMWEGAILCNGDVTFTGGNLAVVGRLGVTVIAESQPLLLVSHTASREKGSVVSVRDQDGSTLLEVQSRQSFNESGFTSPDFVIGNTYGIYVDDQKMTDITLSGTITKTADDGGKFTGGYSRGGF